MHARHTVYTISPSPDATLALEITQTGLAKTKLLLVWERFTGELFYDAQDPLASELNIEIEAASLVCRHRVESSKRPPASTQAAVNKALNAVHDPHLQIRLRPFTAKPLRGFIAQGNIVFRGRERVVKFNVGFGVEKNGRLQIDANAALRLSEFDVACPTSLLGLVKTQDEAVLHALLWGSARDPATSVALQEA